MPFKPALEGPQDHLVEVLRKLKRRADLTVEWAKRTPHVKLVAPKGAFYAHPSLDIPEEDLTFVTDLLQAEACAGGAWFGLRREAGHPAHAHRVSAAGAGAERGATTR